jgi:hypothetical protein
MGWQYLSFGEERIECVGGWTNVGKCHGWNSSSDEQSFSLISSRLCYVISNRLCAGCLQQQ